MSKEKTRSELHAEVSALKAELETSKKQNVDVQTAYNNLRVENEKKENELKEQSMKIAGLDGTIGNLQCIIRNRDGVIAKKDAEIARLKEREAYLEGELKERDERINSQGDRIQKYSETVERIRADRDKAQYIAADLLEHGVFHFLIVKYRNLRAK